jgi:hypothetical protein
VLQSESEGSEKLEAKHVNVNRRALTRKVILNGSYGLCRDILKEIYL